MVTIYPRAALCRSDGLTVILGDYARRANHPVKRSSVVAAYRLYPNLKRNFRDTQYRSMHISFQNLRGSLHRSAGYAGDEKGREIIATRIIDSGAQRADRSPGASPDAHDAGGSRITLEYGKWPGGYRDAEENRLRREPPPLASGENAS